MKVLGVIPARYASTRFPGKPLAQIHGKTMVQRVYEQACKSIVLDDLYVATDDQRIYQEVTEFGGKALMTSETHLNGTERCAEVLQIMPKFDYVINIQGDEPFIDPIQINTLGRMLDGQVELATLIKPITEERELDDPGEMKVIFNQHKEAIYFSRTCIPYLRDVSLENRLKAHTFYKHIGIYAYRSDILNEIVKLPTSSLEKAESLEQLRWLENGYKIQLGITNLQSHMIDTPADLAKLLNETDS